MKTIEESFQTRELQGLHTVLGLSQRKGDSRKIFPWKRLSLGPAFR